MRRFVCLVAVACTLAGPPVSALAQGDCLRVAAEWEPTIGVLIGWPLRIPHDLVVDMARDVDLYVTVNDPHHELKARVTFEAWGIDLRRVHFVRTRQGSGYYLTRDWGPNAVYDSGGRCRLVDGLFFDYPISGVEGGKRLLSISKLALRNYRPDDEAPAAVAATMGLPRTESPIYLTGGNVAFDGLGTAFATRIMIDENLSHGISQDQFLARLAQDFGVRRFHVVPNFERLGIQHLDCLMKLLDEERILVKRSPPDHPDFEHIEEAARCLALLKNPYDRLYQILRIDTPLYNKFSLANYTNALILNRKVYVPLFDIPGDQAALKTWRAAMPGYTIIGSRFSGWNFTDCVHCRVRGVWDPNMVRMTHRRLEGAVPWAASYAIETNVRCCGQQAAVNQVNLFWRRQSSPAWTTVRLQPCDGDVYRGMIAGIQPGQTVEYYVAAASRAGRQETLPRTAPEGCYRFTAAR